MLNTIKKIKRQIEQYGIYKTFSYLVITVSFNKIGIEINQVFRSENERYIKEGNFTHYNSYENIPPDVIKDISYEFGSNYLEKVERKLDNHNIFTIGYVNNCIASTSWIKFIAEKEGVLPFNNYFLLYADYTLPLFRGYGLQKKAISYRQEILSRVKPTKKDIFIESSVTNYASIKNIKRCGFNKVGTYISFRNKLIYSTVRKSSIN